VEEILDVVTDLADITGDVPDNFVNEKTTSKLSVTAKDPEVRVLEEEVEPGSAALENITEEEEAAVDSSSIEGEDDYTVNVGEAKESPIANDLVGEEGIGEQLGSETLEQKNEALDKKDDEHTDLEYSDQTASQETSDASDTDELQEHLEEPIEKQSPPPLYSIFRAYAGAAFILLLLGAVGWKITSHQKTVLSSTTTSAVKCNDDAAVLARKEWRKLKKKERRRNKRTVS
jgi:hypothetical protein